MKLLVNRCTMPIKIFVYSSSFGGGFPSVCHHARLADDGIVSLFKPSKEIIGLSSGVQIH